MKKSRHGWKLAKGRFRLGSYAPGLDGTTRWLCIDLDGDGHADGLSDVDGGMRAVVEIFRAQGIPVYIERSGGGKGWHLWIFFKDPVPARRARCLAFHLIPEGFVLAVGGTADPRKGKGIEVFPKQDRVKEGGVGSAVWLPWWSGAKEGTCSFYQVEEDGEPVPYIPDHIDTLPLKDLDRILGEEEEPEETPIPKGKGNQNAAWTIWRHEALSRLSVERIYGEWLTGERTGDEWLQCRDPDSSSGDRNPSAGVADGSGTYDRGTFHSFISGKTMSVFDFMVDHGMAQDFFDAQGQVAEWTGVPLPSSSNADERLPVIMVSNRQFRDTVRDTWRAIRKANRYGEGDLKQLPNLYRRSNLLVRLIRNSDGLSMDTMNEDATFGLMARVATWKKATEKGIVAAKPPRDVAKDLLAYPHERLPRLDSLLATPVFGRSGNLITKPGYHEDDALILEQAPNLSIPEVPMNPTPEAIKEARELLLDELLGDFPFKDASDRAHAAAAMVLPFMRRMVGGCTPLHLIEAPTAGSGKGLLSNVISIIATGKACEGRILPTAEEETRKMITAELERGRALILLDNVSPKRQLDNPALASVLTAETWTDRILGVSRMITLENQAAWMMTANNPRLSMEIARRCIRIRIDPKVDRPWKREGFRHPDLKGWALAHRGELIHAVLVLIRAWVAAGKPLCAEKLGSFEGWAGMVGGILEVAGIPGFLGNLESLYEEADAEGGMWRDFTSAWWETFTDETKKVAELNQLCDQYDLMCPVRGDKSTQSQAIRLGKALAGARDRVFNGKRIVKVQLTGKARTGNPYRLEEVCENAPSEEDSVYCGVLLETTVQPTVHDVKSCDKEDKVVSCTVCTVEPYSRGHFGSSAPKASNTTREKIYRVSGQNSTNSTRDDVTDITDSGLRHVLLPSNSTPTVHNSTRTVQRGISPHKGGIDLACLPRDPPAHCPEDKVDKLYNVNESGVTGDSGDPEDPEIPDKAVQAGGDR